jgi:hypothetical protein
MVKQSNNADVSPSTSASADHQLVDRIVYLSTLGSDRTVIDPLMDTVRIVTARWPADKPLSESDRASLVELEHTLKHYVIHTDPLRSFTSETLEQRLQSRGKEKEKSQKGINPNARAFIISLILTVVSGLGLLFLPFGSSVTRQLIAAPTALLVLHLCVIWFFLSSLGNFNQKFRRAFLYLCIGVLMLSGTATSLMVVQLFDLTRFAEFKYGYAGILGVIASSAFVFVYIGLRTYARLLSIKHRLTSWPLVTLLVVATCVLITFVPHAAKVPTSEAIYYLASLATITPVGTFALINSVLASKIMHRVTPAYAKSMKVLFFYQASFLVAAPIVIGIALVFGQINGSFLSILMATTAIPPESILLYAGYLFKRQTGE